MLPGRIRWRFYLVYFLYFSGFGIFHPYIYIYFEQIGISKSFIGLLTFLGPLMAMVFQFGLGAIGDLWGKPQRVIQLAVVSAGVLVFGLLVEASVWWYLCLFPLFYGLQAAVDPLVNAAVVSRERVDGEVGGFGNKRLWGSIGFVVGATFSGWLTQMLGLWIAFPIYAVVMMLVVIPVEGFSELKQTGIRFGRFARAVKRSLGVPAYRRLVLFFVLWGIPFGGNFVAFGLYWKELGGTEFGLGIAWVLASFLEVPLYWLTARYRGWINYRWLLVLSGAVAVVRWVLYAVFANVWVWYFVQPLHAVMFVSLSVGGIYLIDRMSDPVIRNTGQGLLAACVFGLGSALGNLLTGVVYDYYGAVVLYAVLAVISGLATLLALVAVFEPGASPNNSDLN